MNLTGWRFLLFAVVGAAAIILLAGISVPGGKKVDVDRHTGEVRTRVRNVADAYHEARAQGDAQKALERLQSLLSRFPDSQVLNQLHAVLRAEFEPPGDAHPDIAAIRAEETRAADARKELRRRIREQLNREALLALLSALEADETQAAAVESYFAPLPGLRKGAPQLPAAMGPDELGLHAKTPEDYLAVAEVMHTRTRTRARVRWLLRAYASGQAAHQPLYDAYLALGRLPEAFLLLGTALSLHPDRIELWQQRARLAGWLSLPRTEIQALLRLLAAQESIEIRKRIVLLYGYLGEPAKAIPHVVVLTRGSSDRTELEWPVRLALQAGDVELALRLLADLADASEDAVYWREQIIRYASQDMRVDRVIAEYEWLKARYPERGYGRKLESLFRQRDMIERLAALLAQRLKREPGNRDLEEEVLRLHVGLHHEQRVRALIRRRLDRNRDPRQFFADLHAYVAIGIVDLIPRARVMARSPALTAQDLEAVLDQLQELETRTDAKWREIASIVADRFVQLPLARATLIDDIDRLPNDADRAVAAEKLSRRHPGEGELLRVWIERAAWSGSIEGEIRARETWLGLEPDAIDNRRALADLYEAVHRPADAVPHWRVLAERAGLDSPETLRYVDALFAAGDTKTGMALLERRAALPGTSTEDRLDVAEQLFGGTHLDRALRFFLAALDSEPEHAHALLRVGQIRAWTNDPRGAIPFLRRRLEVSEEDVGEVRFYLGDTLWAVGEEDEARALHERALEELVEDTLAQDVMRARILTRLGRTDEARPIFERVLRQSPDNVEIVLDYADAMIGIRHTEKARALTERAKELAPQKARTIRSDGNVAILERRYEDAAAMFGDALRLHGPDAGTEAELGRALELAGDARKAHEAYRRSLTLQPNNRDVAESELRLWDNVARIVHANFELRSTGDDSILRMAASGSALLSDGRTRLGAALSQSLYDADGASRQAVTAIQIAGFRTLERRTTLGAGVIAYPGAPGDAPVGGWVELRLFQSDPHRVFGIRANLHTLLDDPAGAVAIGGRSTGITLYAEGDLTRSLWGIVRANYSSLSVETGDVRNGRADLAATIGIRLIEGNTRTGEPLDVGRSALPGLIGPDVIGSPKETRGPLVSAWISFQAIRLLDDRQLATLLPIGERFDYLSVGTRADLHLAPGLGLTLEGYAGTDLAQSDFFFGAEAALTWRPSPRTELTLRGAYGTAVGRADNADTFVVRALFSYRW